MAGILIVDKHVYVRTKLALFSHHTVYHTRALRCARAECITNRSARPLARIYHDVMVSAVEASYVRAHTSHVALTSLVYLLRHLESGDEALSVVREANAIYAIR